MVELRLGEGKRAGGGRTVGQTDLVIQPGPVPLVPPQPLSQRWVVYVHETFLGHGQTLLDCPLSFSQLCLEPAKTLPAFPCRILALVEVALEQNRQTIWLKHMVGQVLYDQRIQTIHW